MDSIRALKQRIHQVLNDSHTPAGGVFETVLLVTIILSTLSFGFQTLPLQPVFAKGLLAFDVLIFGVFSIEYALRLWTEPHKRAWAFSFFGIIDALVLLSFLGPFTGIPWLAWLSVFRIAQLEKMLSFSPLVKSFLNAFKNYRDEGRLVLISFLMVVLMGAFGILALESGINPAFETIGDGIWWAIVTMSTVGYGDFVPITTGGRILGSIVILLGWATMAMLTAMITKIFIDHFFGKQKISCIQCRFPHHEYDAKYCKNCGHSLTFRDVD